MQLRVVIVDDDAPGRGRLRQLLLREPNVEVIAECPNGIEGIQAIQLKSPVLVFLGVRPPKLDSFGVLEALGESPLPAVIFVTAHDQFAAQAFDKYAVDYLLKPLDRPRLQTAIKRARERLEWILRKRTGGARSPGRSAVASQFDPLDYVPIRSRGRINLVRGSEVDWISAADNYAELHVGERSHLLRATLSTLAGRLAHHGFVQVSRGLLVKVDRIKEIQAKSHGDYVVVLQNGARLNGSRNYRHNLAGLLRQSRASTKSLWRTVK